MTRREEILAKVRTHLEHEPDGLRYSVLVKKLIAELPHIPQNTIHGTIWNIDAKHPDEFYKPAKGVFRSIKFNEKEIEPPIVVVPPTPKIKEEDFYQSFADYLVKELEGVFQSDRCRGEQIQGQVGNSGCNWSSAP